ncbi:ComEC/Rec2 family competence protein [Pseudalkalibacillus hwajinpoensis]|uniref:ComEC/Rec2 family competence protein n=1 Tax=Guptibacillus hwajinpoensis TaxID=208199 RepID=UPI001CD2E81D|nr:hypothetical protein [Pseudalkalibacillus hwajinpoensis]MCA0990747.1 hypothetical protein [Pseudalkalibacillus hwajinpoensis]
MKKLLVLMISTYSLMLGATSAEASIQSVDLHLRNHEVAVTFLDLSIGEAILLQSKENGAVLINTGSSHSEQELINRLKMFKVKEIRKLWLTNADEAYTGNFSNLLHYYDVKEVFLSKGVETAFLTSIPSHIRKQHIQENQQLELMEDVNVEILNISKTGSVTFMLSLGSQDLLMMGETDLELEEEIASSGRAVEVLKVANFGAGNGSSTEFLSAIDPQMAVIFRHNNIDVSESVLERLNESWTDVYYPYRIGSVTLRIQNDRYDVITLPTKETR